MDDAEPSVILEPGATRLGQPFIDIVARGVAGIVEARLKDGVLEIAYAEGGGLVFYLGQIQAAIGSGAFGTIKGYATDQMAANIEIPGYVERLARAIGGRLGGAWSHAIVREGVKQWIVFVRQTL